MAETIVLRFRDAAGDGTIESHPKVIADAGHVWWGWWKKDFEPDQTALLAELRDRARKDPLRIGLFDRAARAFFSARLVDVVFHDGPINSPDVRSTPSYYSSEKVPAWLKLTDITSVSDEDFLASFHGVPTGEATLFEVALKEAGPAAPIQIDVKSDLILHISDIHFGSDYGFPGVVGPGSVPLLELIKRDFRDRQVGLVVVSGDLTSRADANVLQNEGLRFLQDLSNTLHVPKECFIIVPGNHDIALRKIRPLDYSHEASFHLFAKEFYGTPIQYPLLTRYRLANGRPLELLAINSVRLRAEADKAFGYVQWPLYDDLLRKMPHDPDVLRVAVLHHHLVSAPREEAPDPDAAEASVSITIDAGAVIEGLQTHGFTIVLHGHQHVPKVSRVARAFSTDGKVDLEPVGTGMVVVAAGSAGSKRLSNEMRDNSYNVLTLLKSGFDLESRRFTPGSAPQPLFRIQVR